MYFSSSINSIHYNYCEARTWPRVNSSRDTELKNTFAIMAKEFSNRREVLVKSCARYTRCTGSIAGRLRSCTSIILHILTRAYDDFMSTVDGCSQSLPQEGDRRDSVYECKL